ncbi:copper chaperone PCu(A)C [Actinoplanes solisilvae]|uniref:copper chaperone PCu(A)C n=1 Tax=Actinoplanes solisilvae TaxID=2486853 RepID=UPI000FD89553|nr:copper chaperone PCu(A)C [Actinoplanes solisilvae]
MQTLARRSFALAALATLSVTTLSACGGTSAETAAPAPTATSAPAGALSIKDPWVKAADKGMTAAFGTLVNNTDKDVTVVRVASPASPMELHEMAMDDGKMVMRPKEGGFVVKAKANHELGPGGDHLMLMNPSAPIKPGDEVQFTLTLSDGSTIPFSAVAKPFAGAGESYAPSGVPSMAGM